MSRNGYKLYNDLIPFFSWHPDVTDAIARRDHELECYGTLFHVRELSDEEGQAYRSLPVYEQTAFEASLGTITSKIR